MRQMVFVGLLMTVVLLSGCSEQNIGLPVQPVSQYSIMQPNAYDSNSQMDNAQTENVVISNTAYIPRILVISKDTIVIWTNDDSNEQTIDSDVGNVSSGAILPGETFAVKFIVPRTYRYHSDTDPSMKGMIVVK